MRTIITLVLFPALAAGAGPTPAQKLRAKAALALAFAPPTYAEQHAKALREGKPLVVFVGRPATPLAGCVCVACESFPDAAAGAVVIGRPHGGTLRRLDLPGRPTADAVRQALATGTTGSTELPGREAN
jgi:hypothetical protein